MRLRINKHQNRTIYSNILRNDFSATQNVFDDYSKNGFSSLKFIERGAMHTMYGNRIISLKWIYTYVPILDLCIYIFQLFFFSFICHSNWLVHLTKWTNIWLMFVRASEFFECFLAFNSALPQYATILATEQPKNVHKHAHQHTMSKLSERKRNNEREWEWIDMRIWPAAGTTITATTGCVYGLCAIVWPPHHHQFFLLVYECFSTDESVYEMLMYILCNERNQVIILTSIWVCVQSTSLCCCCYYYYLILYVFCTIWLTHFYKYNCKLHQYCES